MLESLLERFRRGDRQALSRLLTLSAEGTQSEAIRAAVPHDPASARVVAFTGNGGVGKSSLIGRLIGPLRDRGKKVAVLACDPQSSLSGGALLADRVRMPSRTDDPGLFFRSLAVLAGRQGIADDLDLMIRLLSAFGFNVLLVETAGAGQGDTAVRELADVVVLLVQPESGDEFQWEKAGLLEIADVVVVHKADLPRADWVEAEVHRLLNLPGCRQVPVLRASAAKEEGLEELWAAVEAIPSRRLSLQTDGGPLLRLAQRRLAQRFGQRADVVQPVLDRWNRQELDDSQAADELLRRLFSL